MQLRPYQTDTIKAVEDGWSESSRQLVVAPTGSGKTIMFSHLAQRALPGKTLVLAHRDELIDQAIDKLHRSTGIVADKEKAEDRASLSANVVVASVPTLNRRVDRWPKDHFAQVIVDECHHTLADSYQHVLSHFHDHANVMGCTATPDRGDKRNLGQYFERIAAEIHLLDLINQKYLSPIVVQTFPLSIDLTGVRTIAGDFNEADLGHAIEPYLAQVACIIAANFPKRKTLAFLPLIATSRLFVQKCRDAGLTAQHIDGTSPDRKEILKDFSAGKYQVLSNANLLLEGYDEPSIDCILMLRPTQSRPLYAQAVGRGTRIHPGKENLLVVDFLWQSRKHQLIHPAHLVAESEEIANEMVARSVAAATDEEWGNNEEDLQSSFNDVKAAREAKLRAQIEAAATREKSKADAMELALSLDVIDYEPTMPWEFRPVSEPQANYLKERGIDPAIARDCGHASKLIERIISRRTLGLATPKQLKYLLKFHHPHPQTATFTEANAFLSKIWGDKKKPSIPPVPPEMAA